MTKPKTILLATDLSPRCDRATERSIDLARRWGSTLEVVVVMEKDLTVSLSARQLAASKARAVAAEITGARAAQIQVLAGEADQNITSFAESVDAGLIVTGPPGGSWFGETELGGTIAGVMRRAGAPVLVAKRPAGHEYSRAVIAMDASAPSCSAVKAARNLFGDASVMAFHAFSTPLRLFVEDVGGYEAGMQISAIDEVREALRSWFDNEADKITIIAQHGDPAPGLMRFVNANDSDLVVAGTHGRSGLLGMMLGSVAEEIVRTAPCDVLIAPVGRKPPPLRRKALDGDDSRLGM